MTEQNSTYRVVYVDKPSLWAMTKQSFWAWKEIVAWKTAAFWLAPSL